jgi:hypothetical protein
MYLEVGIALKLEITSEEQLSKDVGNEILGRGIANDPIENIKLTNTPHINPIKSALKNLQR